MARTGKSRTKYPSRNLAAGDALIKNGIVHIVGICDNEPFIYLLGRVMFIDDINEEEFKQYEVRRNHVHLTKKAQEKGAS